MNEPDSQEERLNDLKAGLNGWMPSNGEVENILDASANSMVELDQTKQAVANAMSIQTVSTIEDIKPFGEIVKEYPEEGDSVEFYQKKVLAKLRGLSAAGKPQELLEYISRLFDINSKQITLENIETEGNFRVIVPLKVISNSILTGAEAEDLITYITAATYGVNIDTKGGMEYITESEYNNDNYDTSKGYGTLDSDGNITDDGTYGTTFE